MVMNKFHQTIRVFLVALILVASQAQGSAQDLTEFEWATLPDYCKAALLGSDWAQFVPSRHKVPRSWVDEMLKTYNERIGIPGAHHFCVGMVYISRARGGIGLSQEKSVGLMKQAADEINYSYSRTEKRAPLYSVVTAYYGVALYHSGNRERAFDIWKEGIATQPARPESYVAMAEALRSERKMKEALELLLRFDKAKKQPSAEAEYFLGHTYFDLELYDDAKRHADKAYQLGYPLPGLRNKLRRVEKGNSAR